MGFLKKTLILSNKNKGMTYGIAVLTIEKNNSGVFGTLKTNDFSNENNLIVGLTSGKTTIKQNIMLNNGLYTFKLPNNFEIDEKVMSVLVSGEDLQPLVWGSSTAKANYVDDIIKVISGEDKITKQSIKQCSEEKVEDNEVLTNQIGIEEVVNPNLFESSDEELDNLIDENMEDNQQQSTFYDMVKDQLNELFDKYPAFTDFDTIIPHSKWVKVDYDNNGKVYVVGLIYDEGELKYICYGVPGEYGTMPPKELSEYAQWLPVNVDNPTGEGYWIMYQDAMSGDTITVSA